MWWWKCGPRVGVSGGWITKVASEGMSDKYGRSPEEVAQEREKIRTENAGCPVHGWDNDGRRGPCRDCAEHRRRSQLTYERRKKKRARRPKGKSVKKLCASPECDKQRRKQGYCAACYKERCAVVINTPRERDVPGSD